MSISRMLLSNRVRLLALLRCVSVPLQEALAQQLLPGWKLRSYSPKRALPVLRTMAPGSNMAAHWERGWCVSVAANLQGKHTGK
jgi:hypothetical protein